MNPVRCKRSVGGGKGRKSISLFLPFFLYSADSELWGSVNPERLPEFYILYVMSTALTLTCFDNLDAFLTEAEFFLEQHEAQFNLILAILDSVKRGEQKHPPFLALVKNHAGEIDTLAIRTPPWQLLLAKGSNAGVEAVADVLLSTHAEIPGVHGPEQESRAFGRLWSEQKGVKAIPHKQLCCYMMTRVLSVDMASGAMRTAGAEDHLLIMRWSDRFHEDAATGDPENERRARMEFMLEQGRLVLWEDNGKPVAMAGWHPSPPRGCRIGYVYTPPELRRRGYGTALTAALSQQLLDTGLKYCFLYTDLANVTSNNIYRAIGYQPISESHEYRFV